VVICLERGADLHMAQLIPLPLPLTVSCFSKIQIGFTFVVPAHQGSPGKRAVKRVFVCACVRACVRARVCVCVCAFVALANLRYINALNNNNNNNQYNAERLSDWSAQRTRRTARSDCTNICLPTTTSTYDRDTTRTRQSSSTSNLTSTISYSW